MATALRRHLRELAQGDHVCPIHDNVVEQLAVVVPFILDGLARGERCIYVAHEPEIRDAINGLAALLDVGRERKQGSLVLLSDRDAYLRAGEFRPDEMIDFISKSEDKAIADGFASLRFIGDMSWVLTGGIDGDLLIDYEARLNAFLAQSRSVLLCHYLRSRFDPALLHDVLRTHPTVILGESVWPNPYYEPPELILLAETMPIIEFKRKRLDWWIGQLKSAMTLESERERLAQQLCQSQKMEAIGQLAGGIAHDFNNMLTVIMAYSDLVFESLPPAESARSLLLEIRRAGERSASLTRQLLTFSRRQRLALKILDLNGVVRSAENMLRRMISEDIEFETHLQSDLDSVLADPGQLEQVLVNLAINARDAMPHGGKIVIETANVDLDPSDLNTHPGVPPGSYVLLTVTDTGSGMPEEVRRHLFEPFFTTKEPGKGTGLGLAVVHTIVRQCEGQIEVDSEPGRGTAFRIFVPRVQRAPTLEDASRGDAGVQGNGETILIVEDEGSVRALIGQVLRSRGYSILEAGHPDEALRICTERRDRIDMLITDVVMPGVGGTLLAERLVVLHPEMKVLYTSGYADDTVMRRGVSPAQFNFLPKPFSAVDLAAKVREALQ